MKAQFIVTVEGNWLENGKHVTQEMAEKRLRKAAKEGFEFLADRVTVKRLSAPQVEAKASVSDAQQSSEKGKQE